MTAVIVVEDEEILARAIERDLRRAQLEVRSVGAAGDALSLLRSEAVDVLLVDLRLRDGDGLDLIRAARQLAPRTRIVLMSGYATASDYEEALRLGAVRVLVKPFSGTQLIEAVRQAAECDSGFRGQVHGLGLIDLLQMFHFSQRSLVLYIGTQSEGHVFIESGRIIHAEYGGASGEPALRTLLSFQDGTIRTGAFTEPDRRTIARDFQELLLDALRVMDERNGIAPSDTEDADAPILRETTPGRATFAQTETQLQRDLQEVTPSLGRTACAYVFDLLGQESAVAGNERILDAQTARAACDGLLSAARLLEPDSATIVVERVLGRCCLQLIHSVARNRSYLFADTFHSAGELSAMRARLHATARRLLASED